MAFTLDKLSEESETGFRIEFDRNRIFAFPVTQNAIGTSLAPTNGTTARQLALTDSWTSALVSSWSPAATELRAHSKDHNQSG
jgi:hypothetical protein